MKKDNVKRNISLSRKITGEYGRPNGGISPIGRNLRKSHMGKRTLMVYDRGTCLLVEGLEP